MPQPKSYPLSQQYGIFASHVAVIHAMAMVVNQSQMEIPVLGEVELELVVRAAASTYMDGGDDRAALRAAKGILNGLRNGDSFQLVDDGDPDVTVWPVTGAGDIFAPHRVAILAMASAIPILQRCLWVGKDDREWAIDAMDNMLIAAAKSLACRQDDGLATEAAYQSFLTSKRIYRRRLVTQLVE